MDVVQDRQKKTGSRTLPIRGSRVTELRVGLGMSKPAFASKAGCSTKTITSIEDKNKAMLSTIVAVAKALNVHHTTLLQDPVNQKADANEEATPPHRVRILFKVRKPHHEFDETEDLVELIADLERIIDAYDGIEGIQVIKGSVILVTHMSQSDTIKLIDAFCRGKLDVLSIDEIYVIGLPGIFKALEQAPKKAANIGLPVAMVAALIGTAISPYLAPIYALAFVVRKFQSKSGGAANDIAFEQKVIDILAELKSDQFSPRIEPDGTLILVRNDLPPTPLRVFDVA